VSSQSKIITVSLSLALLLRAAEEEEEEERGAEENSAGEEEGIANTIGRGGLLLEKRLDYCNEKCE
jgi:hypothetical protein